MINDMPGGGIEYRGRVAVIATVGKHAPRQYLIDALVKRNDGGTDIYYYVGATPGAGKHYVAPAERMRIRAVLSPNEV